MAIHLDNKTMPTALATRGRLDFGPAQILGYDGAGDAIAAPTRSATWTWQEIKPSEAAYLFTTVLGGLISQPLYNGLRIYDPTKENAETNFAFGIADRPTFKSVTNGVYKEVVLTIRGIR